MPALKFFGWTACFAFIGASIWIWTYSFPAATSSSAASVQSFRSEQTQKRYQTYAMRLGAYYVSLMSALRADAQTDLLILLEPPKEMRFGYQILPKMITERTKFERRGRAVGYSWAWTDKLIDAASQALERSETALARIAAVDQATRRASYQELAARYLELRSSMRNIAAHVHYNRFWQTAFAAKRTRNERDRKQIVLTGATIAPTAAPNFVKLERRPGQWVIHIALYTDIEDLDFLRTVKDSIESVWRLRSINHEFRVQIGLTMIPPARLYQQTEIPQMGVELNLAHHLSLFPHNGAILTTGARTTHVSGRAIILGPEDISARVLAHEIGHILGFEDRYVRSYQDLGDEGYAIVETIGESNDIMSSSATGTVLPYHFYKLIEQLESRPTLRPVQHEISSTDRGADNRTTLPRSVELSATSMRVASA